MRKTSAQLRRSWVSARTRCSLASRAQPLVVTSTSTPLLRVRRWPRLQLLRPRLLQPLLVVAVAAVAAVAAAVLPLLLRLLGCRLRVVFRYPVRSRLVPVYCWWLVGFWLAGSSGS